MNKENITLTLKDFEKELDLGQMIIIPAKTEIRISYVFKEIDGMAKGGVLMREEQSLFFREEECYLIPSGQFGKLLAHAKMTLIEKGVTKQDGGEGKSSPGDTKVH